MSNRTTRAYNAGKSLAKSLVEAVHLMYQNKTAINFLTGVLEVLIREMERRSADDLNTPTRRLKDIWPW